MEPNGWDMTKAAAAYASLTGLLATVTLTALGFALFYVRRDTLRTVRRRGERNATLIWLTTAFFSLLMTTFMLDVLSADDRFRIGINQGQQTFGPERTHPFVLGVVVSSTFALGALQVILSLLWFFAVQKVDRTVVWCGRVVFGAVIVCIFVYVHNAYVGIDWIRANQEPSNSLISWSLHALCFFLPVMVAVTLRWAVRKRIQGAYLHFRLPFRTARRRHRWALHPAPALFSLLLTVATTILFGVVTDLGERDVRPWNMDSVEWYVLLILGIFVGSYVIAVPPVSRRVRLTQKHSPASTRVSEALPSRTVG